ncbi:MAG: hypothetical protein PWP07_2415 [Epulopiscium sp.]|jgi:uncharacterized membrane protein|nr:SdpI family protein [Defluviitalea raffinosedens]MBM7687042.1 putative membrane protein [Defluviitalea raffinosedens]MBZ4669339.1 hypothetical protein [Defluviitaleaceae bacterium]MDK2789170.1 hypothetical protein [Candidatus Epulonipiscium sp.]HHW68694.1 DUF1648 domain-containing protein [Candidatus Epulonipiscium sp.]
MKHNKWIWLLIVLSFIGTIIVFPFLPEQIPTNWGINGEINDYSSKYMIFFLAALPAMIYLLMLYGPKLDPKKENYKKHSKAYSIISISTVLTLVAIHWLTVLATFNIIKHMDFFIKLIIGILFAVMGNYMSQLRFNYFVGIRLPWTLASEKVWKKTHRIGGIGFMLVGIILVCTSFIRGSLSFIIFMTALSILIIFIMAYAYIEYQKELKTK